MTARFGVSRGSKQAAQCVVRDFNGFIMLQNSVLLSKAFCEESAILMLLWVVSRLVAYILLDFLSLSENSN